MAEKYYWQKRLSAFKLTGLSYRRIKLAANGKCAWSIIYQRDYQEYHGSKEDIDPVPDELMMIKNVQVAILFREIENNMLRVSIRSIEGINVGNLAMLYSGGGHQTVAGCRIHKSERNIKKFIQQASQLVKK